MTMKVLNLGVIALGISALTACGGGSGDSDVSSQTVQPSMPSEISIEAVVVQSKALVDVQSQVIVQADSDVDLSLTSVKEVNNQPTCHQRYPLKLLWFSQKRLSMFNLKSLSKLILMLI